MRLIICKIRLSIICHEEEKRVVRHSLAEKIPRSVLMTRRLNYSGFTDFNALAHSTFSLPNLKTMEIFKFLSRRRKLKIKKLILTISSKGLQH